MSLCFSCGRQHRAAHLLEIDLLVALAKIRELENPASVPVLETPRDDVRRDLTNLVVAADRMLDNWAEGDQGVKNDLWRSLHTLAAEIADRQGLFPLGNPEGPLTDMCGESYVTDVGQGVETYFCQLTRHEGAHEWGVSKPKQSRVPMSAPVEPVPGPRVGNSTTEPGAFCDSVPAPRLEKEYFLRGQYDVLRALNTSPRMHKPQRELIEDLAHGVLQELESLGVKNLAVPPVGTQE
jgi:hypothetical protein